MHVLVLLHRWLGVALCLPIALWFASGIIMHFVPFPAVPGVGIIPGFGIDYVPQPSFVRGREGGY
jgi:hypothetical protein